jgi:hypothetical protein
MTDFEALSIICACIALVVSLVTLNAQRKLQREANELQRVTAELSRKQLELIQRDEERSVEAEMRVSLSAVGSHYEISIRNLGPGTASSISLECLGEEKNRLHLYDVEGNARVGIEKLRAGENVSLNARVYMDSPRTYEVKLSWKV